MTDSRALGRSGRSRDVAFGIAALLPIAGLCGWAVMPAADAGLVRASAAIWAGSLLAFLAGVRRGLSFSEAAGARPAEIVTFLGVFLAALATLGLGSPALGAVGFLAVGVLDGLAARRGEAPGYFRWLRPVQMAAGAAGLAFIAMRTGV